MKRLCTICARGGSKGVKNKNIRDLLGKPLIAYSLEQAMETNMFDGIAVSSDASEILEVAQSWGIEYLIQRPPELASDVAAKIPAIQHCVNVVEKERKERFDVIVDLDVTSPLRTVKDIQDCINLLEKTGVSNVITGARARRSPYFNLVEIGDDQVVRLSKDLQAPVVRRQDAPQCYDMNASIYVWKRSALFSDVPGVFHHDTRLFEMPEERSVDIDSNLDFEWVRFLMEHQLN